MKMSISIIKFTAVIHTKSVFYQICFELVKNFQKFIFKKKITEDIKGSSGL